MDDKMGLKDNLKKITGIYERNIAREYTDPIKNLFPMDEKYVFLVGAGISMGAPTYIPSAPQFVKILLETYAPKEAVEILSNLKQMRYELMVDKIEQFFDKNLKFMDFFEMIKYPNSNHYFLAAAILSQHSVITTNFDYMIERAMMKLLPPEKHQDITPIITRENFESITDPSQLLNTGKFPLYKIHGSCKNIITGKDTKDSLITTIRSLGVGKDSNIFSLEPYKRRVFTKILESTTLIVMGYSGSDDFDISPTLRQIPNLKKVIWIDHKNYKISVVRILKQEEGLQKDYAQKTDKILAEISSRYDFDVYRIKGNTQEFFSEVLIPQLLSNQFFSLPEQMPTDVPKVDFREWIDKVIDEQPEELKFRLACQLLEDTSDFNNLEKVARIGMQSNNLKTREYCLWKLGIVDYIRSQYEEALQKFEQGLKICKEINYPLDMVWHLLALGDVYFNVYMNLEKALGYYEEASEINQQIQDREQKTYILKAFGQIFEYSKNYEKALENYQEALKIDSEAGALLGKAGALGRIGVLYLNMGELEKAFENLNDAIKIASEMNDQTSLCVLYQQLARYYEKHGKYGKAQGSLQKARKYAELTGDVASQQYIYSELGRSFTRGGFFKLALGFFWPAVKIAKKRGDPYDSVSLYQNMADLFVKKGDTEKAEQFFNKAYGVAMRCNLGHSTANILNSYGIFLYKQKKYTEALKRLQQASELFKKGGHITDHEKVLENIMTTKKNIEDFEKSLGDPNKIIPKINLPKKEMRPLEYFSIEYFAPNTYDVHAWIGLFPKEVPHTSAEEAEGKYYTFIYLEKNIYGTGRFSAPENEGQYELRMFDAETGGKEILSVEFHVKKGLNTLNVPKKEYKPGEVIKVSFTTARRIDEYGWVGLMPQNTFFSTEEEMYERVTEMKGFDDMVEGELVFIAPNQTGEFEIKMYEISFSEPLVTLKIQIVD